MIKDLHDDIDKDVWRMLFTEILRKIVVGFFILFVQYFCYPLLLLSLNIFYVFKCVSIVLKVCLKILFYFVFKSTITVIITCLVHIQIVYFYFTDFHLSQEGLERITRDGGGTSVYA